jgi:hypothetical protein
MQPDREQIEIFVEAMFRHAATKGFVSLRAFFEDDAAKPFRITPTQLTGGLPFLIETAVDDADRAANFPKPVVFCPPIATFTNKDKARERDLGEGLALSVECDARPGQARTTLEAILGPATIVVRSGGKWTDPETGEVHDKLHLHWRLREPAIGPGLTLLKKARDIAARYVGGDPSNKPVCHPIRWPGSWHRKAEPILCSIETANPDCEIDLATALAALTAASPAEQPRQKTNGKDHSGEAADWASHVHSIITGDNYHAALVALAAKMLMAGMSDGAAVNLLRGIMDSSTAARDTRWDARFADIPRAVTSAREKFGAPSKPQAPPAKLLMPSGDFVKGFVAPEYIVDGLLLRGFSYSLTATTGAGKTAISLLLAASVAEPSKKFAGLETEHGRVVYFAGENTQDIRQRWIALAEIMGFDPDTIDVWFRDGVLKISTAAEQIKKEVEEIGGAILIIIDTSVAFFEGKDENDTVELRDHAARIRELCKLPGNPMLLTNCHPVKSPNNDNLIPRGAGAYLNEVDGNLTVTRDNKIATLHWAGKIRGPEFEPIQFQLESVKIDRIRDRKGRLMPSVVATHISDATSEALEARSRLDEDMILQAIADGAHSVTKIAQQLGWYSRDTHEPSKSRVHRGMAELRKARLIDVTARRTTLTAKGQKVLKLTAED